jgi:hypothetical protein
VILRLLSAREKLAMRDAVSRLVRLGAKVVGTEAGGLGVRGEMWSLVSSVTFEGLWALSILICCPKKVFHLSIMSMKLEA